MNQHNKEANEASACPQCGGTMKRVEWGKTPFWRCSNWGVSTADCRGLSQEHDIDSTGHHCSALIVRLLPASPNVRH